PRSILARISAPIPRGSPMVTARRGVSLTLPRRRRRRFVGRQRVQAQGDVRLFAQCLEEAADRSFLDELLSHALAQIGERVLATLIFGEQLRDDKLRISANTGNR